MTDIDRIIELLKRLPPDRQEPICKIIETIGKDAGVDVASNCALPADNIGAWVTQMTMKRLSPRTIDMYQYYASKFLETYPKPTRLDVQKYLATQLKGGTSASATKSMQKSITSLFRFLCKENLWPEDVTAELEGIKVPRTEKYVPPIEDVYKVMKDGGWARKKDADKMCLLIVLLMETGLRITEAVTIEKGKLDLVGRTVEVLGKGNKIRKVPLSEPIVNYLTPYIKEHASDSPYLFPGEGAALKHWQIHNAEKTLKRACERAQVKPFTPHSLRHLFATTALRNGARLDVISKVLGHRSTAITSDIYVHTDMADMQEAVDKHSPMSDSHRPEK